MLYDFHARMYDPATASWSVPDPAAQFANPYLAMGNNPVVGIDPDGEFVVAAIVIGAAIGTYIGGTMANDSYDPTEWTYNSTTFGYMLGGSIVGGLSGWAGGAIAASGIPLANTASIVASSLINSVGTHIYTGGETDFSMSFGVGSWDISNGEVEGLWNWKDLNNSERTGYILGSLANVQDAFAGVNGGIVNVKARRELAGHSWIEGDGIDISVAPAGRDLKPNATGLKWESQYLFKSVPGKYYVTPYRGEPISTKLNNVNLPKLRRMTSFIKENCKLNGKGDLRYGVYNGCVNQTSRALFRAGVFNLNAFLPITAPVLLNAELAVRNYGMMFSHIMTTQK